MRKLSKAFILAVLSLYFCNGLVSCAYGHSLVFGPEIYSSESGKSRRAVKSFVVNDVNRKYFISVQSEKSSAQKSGRGAIRINGKLVFPADRLGKQPKMLTKSIRLKRQNKISVDVAGQSNAPVIVAIMSLEEQTVTAKVPPIGEAVDLHGYASVVFPAGAFDSTQDVRISVTASPSIQDIFEADATGLRLPYEIRINTGHKAPTKDIPVSMKYPDSFFSSDYQMHIFARLPDNPDSPGVRDRFVMIDSGLDDVVQMANTTLPKQAFSSRHGKKGTYEAIITVGLIH